ncbi:maker52 [Drosophila busckii]|uniref:Maker52 n=1 Tax=Drosophila busckii TaxID=30019 RepID=A0A0M4EUS4_DROBS|nr:maker52 [Drosophila busckii]
MLDFVLRLLLHPGIDALHCLLLMLKVQRLHIGVKVLLSHLAKVWRHLQILACIDLVGNLQHRLRLDVRVQQLMIALGQSIFALLRRGMQRLLQLRGRRALRAIVGQTQRQLHRHRRDDYILLLTFGGERLE